MFHMSEILVLLAVVLLLFGTGKFPKIMQNFAEGIKSFKKTMNEDDKKTKKTSKSSPKTSLKKDTKKKKNTTKKKK